MKRGYYVHGADDAYGVAVVAPTARVAKNIAYAAGELIGEDWIDVRVQWRTNADAKGLEVGVLHNLHEGLLRGFYGYIEGVCDDCGDESTLELCSGRALCLDCMEKEYRKGEEER